MHKQSIVLDKNMEKYVVGGIEEYGRDFYYVDTDTKHDHSHVFNSDYVELLKKDCSIMYTMDQDGLGFYLGLSGGKMVTNLCTLNLDNLINNFIKIYSEKFEKISLRDVPLVEKSYHPDGPIGSFRDDGFFDTSDLVECTKDEMLSIISNRYSSSGKVL